MARVNVYEHDEYEGTTLAGWFDPDKAERFDAGQDWDNHVGHRIDRVTGSQWIDAALYRTSGGRWVEETDRTRYHDGGVEHRFVSDEQAREWLIRSEDDGAVARFFGALPEESGPAPVGRPEIGALVNVRLGDLQGPVDEWAAEHGVKRAEAIRRLLAAALAAPA